jgi:hypothetical protein
MIACPASFLPLYFATMSIHIMYSRYHAKSVTTLHDSRHTCAAKNTLQNIAGEERASKKQKEILAMGGIEPPSGRRCWTLTSTTTHATTTPHHLSL